MRYGRDQTNKSKRTKGRRLRTKPLLILIGILILSNAFWFMAYLTNKSPNSGEVVATVGKEKITREQWMAAMEKEIGRDTLHHLVNAKVMEVAANTYGIRVSDSEIDLELALNNHSYVGMDANEIRKKVRSKLILEKVLTKDVLIGDELIEANYNENSSNYNTETMYRTAVIVLPTKTEAEQALRELSEGSSFDVLAKERSTDLASARLGGDLGYINDKTENIDQAISAAASQTKVGTTSGVISLHNGLFAIIHVSDIIEGQSFSLKDVKEHIHREIALEQLPNSVSPEMFWKEFNAKWFYGKLR